MLNVTLQELAFMIGTSWQTTNETLQRVEAQRFLSVRRGGLELRNPSELSAISQ